MKTKHLITTALLATLMMGGSMSPLYAQEAATITATCADDFTAAAYLPAETDSFITINAAGIMGLARKAGLQESRILAELAAVESVAMGLPVGWEHLYDTYAAVAELAIRISVEEGIKSAWANMADAAIAPILQQVASAQANQVRPIVENINSISQPAYAVLRVKPGQEQLLSAICAELEHDISQMDITAMPGTEAHQSNGWKGISLNIAAAVEQDSIPAEYKEGLKEIKTFYMVYRVEGNALIFALCDDTAKLKVCANGAESILSTAKADFLQGMEPHRALAAGSISPALLNSIRNFPLAALNAAVAPIGDAFNRIATQCPQMQTEMKSGAASLQQIVAELSKILPAVDSPLTFSAWHDGDLHLTMESDACGESFTTATVNTAGKENAAVYLYGSTVNTPNLPNLTTTINCVFDVVNTYAYTLPADAQREMLMQLGSARMVYAMLPGMLAPVKQMFDSLGNGWCVTVGSAESEGVADTYAGMSINVADRAGLTTGWKGTINTLAAIKRLVAPEEADQLQHLFDDVEATELTPGATLYGCKQSTAAMVLSDTELIFSNDFRYASRLATQPQQETVCGIKAGVNLAPIIKYIDEQETRLTTTASAGKSQHFRQSCRAELLRLMTGGTLYLTTENDRMQLRIDLNTPGLK